MKNFDYVVNRLANKYRSETLSDAEISEHVATYTRNLPDDAVLGDDDIAVVGQELFEHAEGESQ